MRKGYLIIFLILFSSCTSNKDYFTCSWIIDDISIDGKDYGKSVLMFNVLTLKEDGIGEIPRMVGNDGFTEMNWVHLDSQDGNEYIEISGAGVDYFNTVFRVEILDRKRYKVKFTSDRIVLSCTGSYCKYGA